MISKSKKNIKKARQKGIPKKILYSLNEQIISKIRNPSPSEFGMNNILLSFQSKNYNDAETLSLFNDKTIFLSCICMESFIIILRIKGEFDKAIEAHKRNIDLSSRS